MPADELKYMSAYRSINMTRDADGILTVEFHTNGGPLNFTAQDHTEAVDAFYRIAQDRANKIVIVTGAGGDFITGVDFSTFGNVADPGVWSQTHDEGVQILENLANIRVPVIAAVEGRAFVHSEYALLADVIVAGEGAQFSDVPHFPGRSRKSRGVPLESPANQCTDGARMGGCRGGGPQRSSSGAEPGVGQTLSTET